MKTKTIKLNKNEYNNIGDEYNDNDLIILSGARGSGKSYPVAKKISSMLEENEEAKFVYMRIFDKELHTFAGWCQDLNLAKICGCANFKLTRGTPTKGDILLTGFNEKGKPENERIIGKCISLESASIFKSGKYDEYVAVVFEEYIQYNMQMNLEKKYVFNFLENINTIFRNREKHIYVLGNTLKSIPLFDTAIDELTGEMFKNPLKLKIFRNSNSVKTNKFLSYLNGEIYSDDDFNVNIEEFFIIFTNKKYIIWQHKVYNKKHYVQFNNSKKNISYTGNLYLTLKFFCSNSSSNEFYYQNSSVEKSFNNDYQIVINDISNFISKEGHYYLIK